MCEWTINVPLSALLALQELPEQMILLQAEMTQLRRELEALRGIQSQTLQLVSGVKVPTKLVKGGYLNWTPYGEKFGYVSLGKIKNPVVCAFYCTKYVTKDNSRMVTDVGWHLYRASRPLLRPEHYIDLYTRSPEIDRLLTGKYEYCATGFALPRHDVSWADFVALDDSPIDFSSMNPLDAYEDARAEADRYGGYI